MIMKKQVRKSRKGIKMGRRRNDPAGGKKRNEECIFKGVIDSKRARLVIFYQYSIPE